MFLLFNLINNITTAEFLIVLWLVIIVAVAGLQLDAYIFDCFVFLERLANMLATVSNYMITIFKTLSIISRIINGFL